MEHVLAKHIAVTGFRSMSHLTDLLPLARAHCDSDETEAFVRAIRNLAARISLELIEPVLSSHTEVKSEIEENVRRYGKIM